MLNPNIRNALQRSLQVKELMEIAKVSARSIAGADGATIVLREGDLCFYADEDAISPLWKGQRFKMEKCISGWAMIHGKQACISNVFFDERIPIEAYQQTFVKSLVMTPMGVTNSIGAVGVYWSKEYQLSDKIKTDLKDFAHNVGLNLVKLRQSTDS